MSHPYDLLSIPGCAGQLIFTPCPGTRGSSLDEALATLQQAGIARSEAIALVQALRPKAIQHPAHVDWINQFDATH